MKKFPHEQFLDENSIDYTLLPEMLYKRIKGFEELKEDLEHITDEDREKLTGKLETLSHELLEDLEEHFEEHLENNDQEEDEQPEPIQEPEQPVVEEPTPELEPEIQTEQEQFEPESEVKSELEPEIQPEPEVQAEQEQSVSEPEPVKEPTDEEILEGLVSTQKHLVLPSELKEKGFKTSLNGKRIMVGKFCLHRGKYDSCYKIILQSE